MRSVVAAIAVLVGVLAPASLSQGQFGRFGGMDFDPAVSTEDLTRYAALFELNEDQQAVAEALLQGYQLEFQEAAGKMRETMDAVREEFRETRDPSIWRDMEPVFDRYRETTEQMEEAFLNDFRLLLSEDQLNQWPSFERMRRRDETLSRSFLSGEGVDVARLASELALSDEQQSIVNDIVNRYELELDRALIERNRIYEESMNQARDLFRSGDFDRINELFNEAREAGAKVRDINRRYARQIESAVEGEAAQAFERNFNSLSYPRVYRRSYADRALDTVRTLEDLTPEQREQIGAIEQSYRRDTSSINEQWAEAIEESEMNRSVRDMFGRGRPSEQERELRERRRDLDEQAVEQIRAVLTEDQRQRLPEPDERERLRQFGDEDDEDGGFRGRGAARGARGQS